MAAGQDGGYGNTTYANILVGIDLNNNGQIDTGNIEIKDIGGFQAYIIVILQHLVSSFTFIPAICGPSTIHEIGCGRMAPLILIPCSLLCLKIASPTSKIALHSTRP